MSDNPDKFTLPNGRVISAFERKLMLEAGGLPQSYDEPAPDPSPPPAPSPSDADRERARELCAEFARRMYVCELDASNIHDFGDALIASALAAAREDGRREGRAEGRAEFAGHSLAAQALYDRIYAAVEGVAGPGPAGESPGEAVERLAGEAAFLRGRWQTTLAGNMPRVRDWGVAKAQADEFIEGELAAFRAGREGGGNA